MSRAYPFRRPPEDVLQVAPWSRVGPTGASELPPEIPDWDYDTVLSLARTVRVDGRRARRSAESRGGPRAPGGAPDVGF